MDSSPAPQFLDDIYGCRVQGVGCTQASRLLEFLLGHINDAEGRSQSLPDLYSKVAQAAHAEDRQPLPWLDFGVFQGAIDGDARAEKWRSIDGG